MYNSLKPKHKKKKKQEKSTRTSIRRVGCCCSQCSSPGSFRFYADIFIGSTPPVPGRPSSGEWPCMRAPIKLGQLLLTIWQRNLFSRFDFKAFFQARSKKSIAAPVKTQHVRVNLLKKQFPDRVVRCKKKKKADGESSRCNRSSVGPGAAGESSSGSRSWACSLINYCILFVIH